jgi:7-carboxy-7-deazaguanine synthase (Cx14CxxC type)
MAKRGPGEIEALYKVKEIFYSLQGEGHHVGRSAVFIRFSGCNLWSGHESGRSTALCTFCDTDFLGLSGILGGQYDADQLVKAALSLWPGGGVPFVVCTGGEPLLQMDDQLIAALRCKGCTIAVETNGTMPAPMGIDWITVSPKTGAALIQTSGDELKIVYPQEGLDPASYEGMAFEHFFLQPVDSPNCPNAVAKAIEYCLAHPKWRLSVQMHKVVGIK